MNVEKLDHRRDYYLVLDCETATLPFAEDYAEAKDKIAIAKPLIYDMGWAVIDKKGTIYRKKHFLTAEVFSVPSVFNTAYYKEKRPLYTEMLRKGEITVKLWNDIVAELEADLAEVVAVGAYNAMFDYKKAITFTERYIKALNEDYADFEHRQRFACERIAEGNSYNNDKKMDTENFILRNKKYPMFDIWGLACKYLLNNDDFRGFCSENGYYTKSGKYYSTTAETCYRYLYGDTAFEEAHTALNDTIIESDIFSKVAKKTKKIDMGIIFFPFKIVGIVE